MSDMLGKKENEKRSDRPQFLAEALHDGRYTPNLVELSQLLQKLDLKKKFGNAKLVSSDKEGVSISFDSLEKSHLFALVVYTKGFEQNLWGLGPSDSFFTEKPLNDLRFDGARFCIDETLEDGRSVARIYTRFNEGIDPEGKAKYLELVRDVVKEAMPHLANAVDGFRFE